MRSVALLSRVLWSLERVSSPRKPPPLCDPPASSCVRSEASWRCSPHEDEATQVQTETHLSDACLHMQECGQRFRLRLSELSIPAAGSGDMYCLSRMFCVSLMNAAGILTLHTCPAVFDARARHLRVHEKQRCTLALLLIGIANIGFSLASQTLAPMFFRATKARMQPRLPHHAPSSAGDGYENLASESVNEFLAHAQVEFVLLDSCLHGSFQVALHAVCRKTQASTPGRDLDAGRRPLHTRVSACAHANGSKPSACGAARTCGFPLRISQALHPHPRRRDARPRRCCSRRPGRSPPTRSGF